MIQNRVKFIFTYGTLMSTAEGSPGIAERAVMAASCHSIGTASIRGRLFDAGACPGAILGGNARDHVVGELWQLPGTPRDLIAMLDGYEGCAPHCPLPHPYLRKKIRIRAADGRRVTGWIYVWTGSTADLTQLADGRWRSPSKLREKAMPSETLRV